MKCTGCRTDYDPAIAAEATYVSAGVERTGNPHRRCPHAACAMACESCYPELVRR